jgi:phenylpropionate dioxygenase-like ring-hydroxylating dioxygenase large terminal subunit
MLSATDNETATNTNRGTPMGELFRRFWLPVALSSELPGPDCIPLRVKVLGEDLIAFRGTDGRVGLMDAYCPHRGAPMFFGRNEEDGLRCVYHGWKFDVDGVCVDLPNAPEGETFKKKIEVKSYPCVDKGDLIWAYMGPKDKKPPFPEFEWTKLEPECRYVSKFRLECNYLQAMEGDYDPSHGRFLHSTLADQNIPNPLDPNAMNRQQRVFAEQTDPNIDINSARFVGTRRVTAPIGAKLEDTDSGIIATQAMQQSDGSWIANLNVVVMLPIFCTAGIGGKDTFFSNMRIPIDNESLMFYRLRWKYTPIPQTDLDEYKHGEYYYPALVPGSWQTKDNVTNDYNIDRVIQKNYTYTGIRTFPLQDIAMMENQWGPIADRTQEHLTSSDYQIIHVRRRLLKAAEALAAGQEPTEPWHPEAYRYRRTVATGATEQEAIDNCKRIAFGSLLQQREAQAPAIAAS